MMITILYNFVNSNYQLFFYTILAKEPIGELNPNQKVLKQLTALLNETEKDDFQYEPQEDIKRLRSDVNRNAEIKNMEYIKNIIIKVCPLFLKLKLIYYV